jgi:hypothetical protein
MVTSVGFIPWYLNGATRALFSRWIISFPVQNTFLQHDAGWKVGEDDKDTCAKKICFSRLFTNLGFADMENRRFLIVAASCLSGDVIGTFWATALWLLQS